MNPGFLLSLAEGREGVEAIGLVQVAAPEIRNFSLSSKGIGFPAVPAIQLKQKERKKVNMRFPGFALSFICLIPFVLNAADPPSIKKVNAPYTSPSSGSDMFKQYCAACHGTDAKGHGPAALALKVPPSNLTVLSMNNHGKFPDVRVYSAIIGDSSISAHGSAAMPVWGTLFREMSSNADDNRQVAMRLSNLCRYIESLQQK